MNPFSLMLIFFAGVALGAATGIILIFLWEWAVEKWL